MALKTVQLELSRFKPDGTLAKRTIKAERHFSLGWTAQKERRWRDAIGHYTRALEIDRALFSAWSNRGMCWHQLGKPHEALRDYEKAFAIGSPQLRQIIRVNRGVLYGSVRRYDEALADFAADQSFESRLNAAYIHLMRGDLERGLQLYRQRPAVRQWRAPLHSLEELAGKSVLILHEQGFGDSIQMARFVPQVAAVAKPVHWTTRTALMPLLAGNLPGVTFSDGDTLAASVLVNKHDAFVLVMDLWQTCGLRIDGGPYLRADPQRIERMRERLPPGRKIGLSWRGRTEFANDHNRSMTFGDLQSAISEFLMETIFVSLQKDLSQRDWITPIPDVFDGGALIDNFADSAALISCLDAVISVDTATAHLAGALGVKTAVLLPYAADWRWGESGDSTPWYDSVRLFRQPDFGTWAQPVAAAAAWCVAD